MASRAPIRATRTRTGVIGSRAGSTTVRGYIRGGPELMRALARLEQGVKDALLQKATLAGGKVLEEAWKERVPIKDGNYRAAITAQAKPGKRGATGLVSVKDVPGVDKEDQPKLYASRLEFGSARATHATLTSGRTDFASRGRVAQPSLRPAFDSVQGEMLDAMADEVKRLIEAAT
jgi:HK97 gp10 family phage protein